MVGILVLTQSQEALSECWWDSSIEFKHCYSSSFFDALIPLCLKKGRVLRHMLLK